MAHSGFGFDRTFSNSPRISHDGVSSRGPSPNANESFNRQGPSRRSPPTTTGVLRRTPSPAFSFLDAWESWTVQAWQFIRLKMRTAPGVVWRYAYALETKKLEWGGTLRVLWAKHGEYGGLDVDANGGKRLSARQRAPIRATVRMRLDTLSLALAATGGGYIMGSGESPSGEVRPLPVSL